jgi:hypothetical protein
VKIGDFEVEVSSGRVGGSWQAVGVLPDGQKVTSAPCKSREDAEHDVKQQAESHLYPQRRYDVNRPFESLQENDGFDDPDWKDVTPSGAITFTRDVEALVQGGPLSFGAVENESFQAGQSLPVKSVEMGVPDADMAKIVLRDGRLLIISIEDFELTESIMNESKWLKGAINPDHKGYCTPMTKETCTPKRKALARRFKSGDLSPADEAVIRHKADRLLEAPQDSYGGPLPECPSCVRYLEVLDDVLDMLTVQRPEIGKMLPATVQGIRDALEGHNGIASRTVPLMPPKKGAFLSERRRRRRRRRWHHKCLISVKQQKQQTK